MEQIMANEGYKIISGLIKTIQVNKEYLSELDGAIGDGDHGVNMNKGFTFCEKKLKNIQPDLAEAFDVLGKTLLMEIGGSMGPLYGTLFIGMSKSAKGKTIIGKSDFKDMLKEGLEGIQEIVTAKVGDKTLMDTLVPGVEAYEKAMSENKSFSEALLLMKKAAEKGKNATRDMVARVGRASRLGERSRGVLDAGATSCNLILQSIADTMVDLIKGK